MSDENEFETADEAIEYLIDSAGWPDDGGPLILPEIVRLVDDARRSAREHDFEPVAFLERVNQAVARLYLDGLLP